jgi:glycosyltransferase involved in cell wall biosynthesis
VRFLGWQPDEVVRQAVAQCRAFIFPGEEEFGIAPLEATAAGRPLIAYGRGALTETVVDGVTGLFFREQSAPALIDALERGEVTGWSPEKIRAHALRFGEDAFRAEMTAFVTAALGAGREARAAC